MVTFKKTFSWNNLRVLNPKKVPKCVGLRDSIMVLSKLIGVGIYDLMKQVNPSALS